MLKDKCLDRKRIFPNLKESSFYPLIVSCSSMLFPMMSPSKVPCVPTTCSPDPQSSSSSSSSCLFPVSPSDPPQPSPLVGMNKLPCTTIYSHFGTSCSIMNGSDTETTLESMGTDSSGSVVPSFIPLLNLGPARFIPSSNGHSSLFSPSLSLYDVPRPVMSDGLMMDPPPQISPSSSTLLQQEMMAPTPLYSPSKYSLFLRKQLEVDIDPDIHQQTPPIKLMKEIPKLTDLLQSLADDLQSSQSSFIDEFANEHNSGISLILDVLRDSLNQQQCPGMVFSEPTESGNHRSKDLSSRNKQILLKKAMTNEYNCLSCLQTASQRNTHVYSKMLSHKNGLSTLASCIVSNLTKSRIIALQLLTDVCSLEPEGSCKVLEAMSVMRIVFGESVRFKLLTSVLMNNSVNGLEGIALTLINTLLAKSPSVQERVRLQSELHESGFSIKSLEKKAKSMNPDDAVHEEISKWKSSYVDLNKILSEKRSLTREVTSLKEKMESLKTTISKLEGDKMHLLLIQQQLSEKCSEYEHEMAGNGATNQPDMKGSSPKVVNGKRPGSYSSDTGLLGTTDSGRWSDERPSSEEEVDHMGHQQNERNEDIFIYIPASLPPLPSSQPPATISTPMVQMEMNPNVGHDGSHTISSSNSKHEPQHHLHPVYSNEISNSNNLTVHSPPASSPSSSTSSGSSCSLSSPPSGGINQLQPADQWTFPPQSVPSPASSGKPSLHNNKPTVVEVVVKSRDHHMSTFAGGHDGTEPVVRQMIMMNGAHEIEMGNMNDPYIPTMMRERTFSDGDADIEGETYEEETMIHYNDIKYMTMRGNNGLNKLQEPIMLHNNKHHDRGDHGGDGGHGSKKGISSITVKGEGDSFQCFPTPFSSGSSSPPFHSDDDQMTSHPVKAPSMVQQTTCSSSQLMMDASGSNDMMDERFSLLSADRDHRNHRYHHFEPLSCAAWARDEPQFMSLSEFMLKPRDETVDSSPSSHHPMNMNLKRDDREGTINNRKSKTTSSHLNPPVDYVIGSDGVKDETVPSLISLPPPPLPESNEPFSLTDSHSSPYHTLHHHHIMQLDGHTDLLRHKSLGKTRSKSLRNLNTDSSPSSSFSLSCSQPHNHPHYFDQNSQKDIIKYDGDTHSLMRSKGGIKKHLSSYFFSGTIRSANCKSLETLSRRLSNEGSHGPHETTSSLMVQPVVGTTCPTGKNGVDFPFHYKRHFLKKSHGNIGLYSGSTGHLCDDPSGTFQLDPLPSNHSTLRTSSRRRSILPDSTAGAWF